MSDSFFLADGPGGGSAVGQSLAPPRAELLLAARAEQVRRLERQLAESRQKAAQLEDELDRAAARLRWSEAVAEDRRRLLHAEQRHRLAGEAAVRAQAPAPRRSRLRAVLAALRRR